MRDNSLQLSKQGQPVSTYELKQFDLETVANKLSCAAKLLANLKSDLLDKLKANHSDLKRDDFLWHYILQSLATWGGSSGRDGLIGNPKNYEQLTFDIIKRKRNKSREAHAAKVFALAKVRYAPTKGRHFVGCFDRIQKLGGLVQAKDQLLDLPGQKAKIQFLKSFPGIGDKYARNIMMDVYHEDFRDSIAVDSRIIAISEKWSLKFNSYDDHEEFYLGVAKIAGLNGWELDRLMYRFNSVFFPPITSPEKLG